MTDVETTARQLLDDLQSAVAGRDLAGLREVFDDEIVLFGTVAANADADSSWAYLHAVVGQEATPRWGWEHVVPFLDVPGVLGFAVVGTVSAVDDHGRVHVDAEPFRLTCVAVERDGRWRLRHFHGSQPAVH